MGDLKEYQSKSGKEAHTIFADPRLNADHTLQRGSPAIAAGIDVGYPYLGSAPDLGALEYSRDNQKPIESRR